MTDITDAEKRRRMAALTQEERVAAIDASPNVIGFDRMSAREQQVVRSHSFRSPTKPSGAA